MTNGLLFRFSDISRKPIFIPISSRDDLTMAKDLLEEANCNPAVTIICGCGLEAGEEREMYSRKCCQLGAGDQQLDTRENYVPVREAILGHPAGCVFERAGDADAVTDRRNSSIFRSRLARTAQGEPAEKEAQWRRRSYDTFSRFCRHALSLASFGVFRAVNEEAKSPREFRNPTTRELFESIHATFGVLRFSDGENSYEAATCEGVELRFGVVVQELPSISTGAVASMVVWWWRDGHLDREVHLLDSDWAAEAFGSFTVFGNTIHAPFFIVAAVEPDGTVRRFFLHCAYFSEAHTVLCDSGREIAKAAMLLASGAVILKPLDMREYQALPRQFHATSLAAHTWPYRPDFLVLWDPAEPENVLIVIEVRGFEAPVGVVPNTTAAKALRCYDDLWRAKEVYYRQLEVAGDLRFVTVDGGSLPPPPEAPDPIEFGSLFPTIAPLNAAFKARLEW